MIAGLDTVSHLTIALVVTSFDRTYLLPRPFEFDGDVETKNEEAHVDHVLNYLEGSTAARAWYKRWFEV